MNTIDILRNGSLFVQIKPEPQSTQTKQIMGANDLILTFQMNHYANFFINDYCVIFGETYKMNRLPIVKKFNDYLYEYTVTMNSEGYDLSKVQYLFFGADNTLTETDFSLMGNSDTFIDLLIQNANRVQSGWTKGIVMPTEYKNLTFTSESCYNALSRLAEAFETEFWIEGKIIHLAKRSRDTGLVFKQGRYEGLYELIRKNVDSTDLFTRLYVFGSTKNLPPDYRSVGEISSRLVMAGGPERYVENNVSGFGVIEATQIFEDIYPHRTGTVTSINPADFYEFTDGTIDFNVNDQLLPGITAKVTFNTGQLAGYEFQVSSFDNATKKFLILKNEDEKVLEVPSSSLKPAIGDKYVLVDIRMPQSYINTAEDELLTKAMGILARVSTPQVSFDLTFDPVYLKKKNLVITIGDEVNITDEAMEINQRKLRVVGTTRNIENEFQFQVEISDTVSPGTISRILNSQGNTGRDVAEIQYTMQNAGIFNNRIVGDLKIEQGTIEAKDLPTTAVTTGFSELLINNTTGKIYRKV